MRNSLLGVVSVRVVDAAFVGAAHHRKMPVQVWTVNDMAETERLLDLGMNGITSDRTTVLKEEFRQRNPWRWHIRRAIAFNLHATIPTAVPVSPTSATEPSGFSPDRPLNRGRFPEMERPR